MLQHTFFVWTIYVRKNLNNLRQTHFGQNLNFEYKNDSKDKIPTIVTENDAFSYTIISFGMNVMYN